MKLTAENVWKVMEECADPTGDVEVNGIITASTFNAKKLESRKEDIASMLSELPLEFRQDPDGGWSFLNACMTRDGKQWGEHPSMEALFVLGIGVGLVSWMLPRSLWDVLPGGMPYVTVKGGPDGIG